MKEYIISDNVLSSIRKTCYEAGKQGRQVYTVRGPSEEVVRCGECKHYEPEYTWEEFREVGYPYEICGEPPTCTLGYALSGVARDTIPNGFCAWGERREA